MAARCANQQVLVVIKVEMKKMGMSSAASAPVGGGGMGGDDGGFVDQYGVIHKKKGEGLQRNQSKKRVNLQHSMDSQQQQNQYQHQQQHQV